MVRLEEPNGIIVIVANKIDLVNGETAGKGKYFATENNFEYVEVSSVSGVGIEKLCEKICMCALEHANSISEYN